VKAGAIVSAKVCWKAARRPTAAAHPNPISPVQRASKSAQINEAKGGHMLAGGSVAMEAEVQEEVEVGRTASSFGNRLVVKLKHYTSRNLTLC
jgi:hypothetical protein